MSNGILDLLRLLIWEGNTEFYSSCDSADISIEQAFRESIYIGVDGLPVLLIKGDNITTIWNDSNIWDDTNTWTE